MLERQMFQILYRERRLSRVKFKDQLLDLEVFLEADRFRRLKVAA